MPLRRLSSVLREVDRRQQADRHAHQHGEGDDDQRADDRVAEPAALLERRGRQLR